MPTNDERREVAARLRNVSGAPEWATTACCIAELIGEYDYPLWGSSKYLFDRLAEFIEPEPERTARRIWDKHNDYFKCENCDKGMKPEWRYCPSCGADVVG